MWVPTIVSPTPAATPLTTSAATANRCRESSVAIKWILLRTDLTIPLCKNMRMYADSKGGAPPVDNLQVELAAEVFAMLADATRIRIILALTDGEQSVNELAEAVGKSSAGTSQHLAKMRLARIVSTRQEGTKVFYRLENEHARQLVSQAIFQAEHTLGDHPAHHSEGAL